MKGFLSFLFAVMVFIPTNAQLTNGLVSYWKLDESSGSTAADAIGTNNGTIIGPTVGQSGKLGTSYYFDGSNDYVSVPNSSSLNIQSNLISLSAWIRVSSETDCQMIISKICTVGSHVDPYFQYNLQLLKDGSYFFPRFWLTIGGSYVFTANTTYNLSLNLWHHIVGTYNGSTMVLYADGVQISSLSVTGNITGYSTPVYIGINGALGEPNNGYIDEVGIWSRALSASEVTQLYNSGSGFSFPFGLYKLTTSISPTSSGSISISPSGPYYSSGTSVTLTASPNSGYAFSSWSGGLTGSTNPSSLTMSSDKSVTATFTTSSNQAPVASNVTVYGTFVVGQTLTSSFSYNDAENNPQGTCLYKWYRSDNGSGTNEQAISGATSATYTLTSSDLSKFIRFEVTPVATAGTSPGTAVKSNTFYGPVTQTIAWQTSGSNTYYTAGKVSIGTTIANSASALTVNGKILATEVQVVSSITADFVFEAEYKLMPLTDLEKFLIKNKHLPEIPSVAEFSMKGQDLAKMDDMLLRKIEELTLYIIQQDKRISQQEMTIENLKGDLKLLQNH